MIEFIVFMGSIFVIYLYGKDLFGKEKQTIIWKFVCGIVVAFFSLRIFLEFSYFYYYKFIF